MIPDQSFAMLAWNRVQEIFIMGGFPGLVSVNWSNWGKVIIKGWKTCLFTKKEYIAV